MDAVGAWVVSGISREGISVVATWKLWAKVDVGTNVVVCGVLEVMMIDELTGAGEVLCSRLSTVLYVLGAWVERVARIS